MENNNADILNKEVGTKELETLKAVDVTVKGVVVQDVFKKGSTTEAVGKKAIFSCKHPDREELIKISQVSFLKGKTLKVSTLWVNLDEDGNIQKSSTVDMVLAKSEAKTLSDMMEKVVSTDVDESGYLCFKAY